MPSLWMLGEPIVLYLVLNKLVLVFIRALPGPARSVGIVLVLAMESGRLRSSGKVGVKRRVLASIRVVGGGLKG